VTQTDEGRLLIASSSYTQSALDGVTVNGDLDLTTGFARVRIQNGLTLNGTARIDNNGALAFIGNQTFDNASVVFEGNSGYLSAEGNTTLTLGPAMVVRGKTGTISRPIIQGLSSHIINQGLISADTAGGTLTINPVQFTNTGTVEEKDGGNTDITSGTWSNAGLVTATGGALALGGSFTNTGTVQTDAAAVDLKGSFTKASLGTFLRTGGSVQVSGLLNLTGDTLTLDSASGSWTLNGGTVRGGTVAQAAGGRLLFSGNAQNTLDGVAVSGDLDLTTGSARLLVRNGLALTGTVRIDNNGGLGFTGTQAFDNASVVFEGNSGSLSAEGNGTVLTLGPATVVRGKSGTIGQSFFLGGNTHIVNQGLISADVAGGTLRVSPAQFTNTGTVEQKDGGTIVVP
jgi:hypothetical protein